MELLTNSFTHLLDNYFLYHLLSIIVTPVCLYFLDKFLGEFSGWDYNKAPAIYVSIFGGPLYAISLILTLIPLLAAALFLLLFRFSLIVRLISIALFPLFGVRRRDLNTKIIYKYSTSKITSYEKLIDFLSGHLMVFIYDLEPVMFKYSVLRDEKLHN